MDTRPWDAPAAANEEIQDQVERWNFWYANEELFIGDKLMLFAYPKFWTFVTRVVEYDSRDDESISFEYKGKDSLVISRDSVSVGLKYKMFNLFHATANIPELEPIRVSLTDSCDYPGTVVDTSWIHPFIWGIDDALEKGGLSKSGKSNPGSRFSRHRR